MESQLLIDLFNAYFDARRHKRNTINQLRFELNYESNLLQLRDDILSGAYDISRSICFIVNDPVKREIIAADFRDRVVHHLIYNYINPILDPQFIEDSYSCRKEKGTLYGIKRAYHFMQTCSRRFTSDCYILKLDIQGYFMHIDKHILWQKLQAMLAPGKTYNPDTGGKLITEPHQVLESQVALLDFLLHKTIFHDPTLNCTIRGKKSDWEHLPVNKSLLKSRAHQTSLASRIGLPIGNLTSQLFSNVYLHALDMFVKNSLKIKFYGRYVDDFIMIHEDKDFLLYAKREIETFLHEDLRLTLHPKKVYLQHVSKGVKFLGAYIKPHRSYAGRRVVSNFKKLIAHSDALLVPAINETDKKKQEKILTAFRAKINSYLGFMQNFNTYNLRYRLLVYKPWFMQSPFWFFVFGYFAQANCPGIYPAFPASRNTDLGKYVIKNEFLNKSKSKNKSKNKNKK